MIKRWFFTKDGVLTQRARAVVLPVLFLIAVGAVVLAIVIIVVMPRVNPGSQRGVGADGFQMFVEENGDLGMANVVSRGDVESALGKKAKIVSDVSVSKVVNVAGSRGQTATYNFVRADGTKASLYVDLMDFKTQAMLDFADVTKNTMKTNDINGHPAYYMRAQTLGSIREYRLLVTNGQKVYKFVIDQPYRNITISEVAALATLKKLAAKAQL